MELQCEMITSEWVAGLPGKRYTCYVTEASITEPGTLISNFKGNHEAGKEDSDVEVFFANECTIKYLPIGLCSFFPDLKELTIESCDLVSLSRKDLNGLEGLEYISFRNNELTSLPSDLFAGFKKLTDIRFYNNKLERMSSKLLEPIMQNELDLVDFRHNTNIDAIYEKGKDEMILKQLMSMIDEQCKKPDGDPGFDLVGFGEFFVKSSADTWTTKVLSDFTIVTRDSKEIPVHKFVLGLLSSVFAAAFNLDMEEKRTNRMVIDSFDPEAVEQFLKFFYTGRISNDLHAMELFALASQYEMSAMKTKCEEVVLRNLNETNAFEIFVLGHLHSSADMKEKAFNQIKESMPNKSLNESLKDDPEKLKIVVEAARERVRKIQAAEDEFNEIKKTMEDGTKEMKNELK